MAIALFVSVVANLFLGGLTLGWMLHIDRWPWQSTYVSEFGSQAGRAVEHLVRNLDSTDRDMVVDTIRAHGDELAQYAKAMRDQRETVKKLLRAPDFDRTAAEDAFAKMRRLTDDMQAALGKAILEAVEKLSPQARQRMAD